MQIFKSLGTADAGVAGRAPIDIWRVGFGSLAAPYGRMPDHAAERYGGTRGARSPCVNPRLVARSVSYRGPVAPAASVPRRGSLQRARAIRVLPQQAAALQLID